LAEACRLYNGALQERRDAWKQRVSVNYYTQAHQLKQIRAAGDLSLANFSCCQDILRRVDQTYQAFFLRVKRQQKAGFPRFKSRRRFASITFPSYGDGIQLNGNRLRVQGVGPIEVKWHRPIAGAIKTTTVKRACGQWYVRFAVDGEAQPLAPLDNAIGIDLGLAYLAALTEGPPVPNPRCYPRADSGTSFNIVFRSG
jgi:putative transposase